MRVECRLDVTEYQAFARDLRRADPVAAASLRKNLKAAGEIVAADARARASFSKKIVPTIRVKVSGANVVISAGGPGVPIAGLEELGNAAGGSKSAAATGEGRFRHPVFGNKKVWVNQPMHPYLAPAVETKAQEAVDKIADALDDAMRTAAGG